MRAGGRTRLEFASEGWIVAHQTLQHEAAATLRASVVGAFSPAARSSGQQAAETASREPQPMVGPNFSWTSVHSDRRSVDRDLEATQLTEFADELDRDAGVVGGPGPGGAAPVGAPPPPAPLQAVPPPPFPALSATLPAHIRSTSTPATMAQDRIPPRVDTPIAVGVAGVHPPMLGMTISVEGSGADNGTLTIDGAAQVELLADTTVNLRGVIQSTPGKGGNLRLVAKQGSTVFARSSGFSVSAIPQNFSVTFNSQINTATMRGLAVNNHWESDSGNVADLDQAERSEQVQYGAATGIWAGVVGGNNSGYLPADSPPLTDSHGTPLARFTGPGSRIAEQTFTFNDKRAAATNIPATRSGFRLTRTAGVNGAGRIEFTVDKRGADTTANGYASKAGSGSVARMQVI